jgi:hypothetical protein
MRAGPEVAAYTKFDKTRWNVTVPPTKGFKISAAVSPNFQSIIPTTAASRRRLTSDGITENMIPSL